MKVGDVVKIKHNGPLLDAEARIVKEYGCNGSFFVLLREDRGAFFKGEQLIFMPQELEAVEQDPAISSL